MKVKLFLTCMEKIKGKFIFSRFLCSEHKYPLIPNDFMCNRPYPTITICWVQRRLGKCYICTIWIPFEMSTVSLEPALKLHTELSQITLYPRVVVKELIQPVEAWWCFHVYNMAQSLGRLKYNAEFYTYKMFNLVSLSSKALCCIENFIPSQASKVFQVLFRVGPFLFNSICLLEKDRATCFF